MKVTGAKRSRRAPMASSGNSYKSRSTGVSRRGRFPNLLPWAFTLITGGVLVALLSVALLFAYRFFTTSDYFAVKEIAISGNIRLGDGEVISLAGFGTGDNSLAVRMGNVETRLLSNPWITGVSVKRELPDIFEIEVIEREPVWWLMRDGKLVYADVAGNPIAMVGPEKFTSLPVLTVEDGMEDILPRLPVLAAELKNSQLPIDMNNASWVRVSHARGVEMYLENTGLRVVLGLADWQGNILRLAAVLKDLSRRHELRQVREVRVQGINVWVRVDPPLRK